MKKSSFFIFFLIVLGFGSYAQNIGIGTQTPDSSALLELSSNSKGFLPPRMTTTERNAISNPAVGLMIYNTTTDCVEVFSKGRWQQMFCGTVDSSLLVDTTVVTDIDGNTYPTVKICNQTWMAKNLDVARYRNGDIIPQVTDPTQWANLTTGAWCWYNNDSATYGSVYGRLYNWYAVNDPRGLAPQGWHVASDGEWNKSAKCLDESVDTSCTNCWSGNLIGSHLKNGTGWVNNGNGNNSINFSAIPGGDRIVNGEFQSIGSVSNWWSSSEYNSINAWNRILTYSNNNIARSFYGKSDGLSVRCVKNAPPPSTIDSGLVAYYPFNGNANDESGNGNNGVVNGGVIFQNDRNGNASSSGYFNGNSFIELPTLQNIPYFPTTYSVWVNPNSLVTENFPLGNFVAILGRDLCGQPIMGQLGIWNNPQQGINQLIHYYTGNAGSLFNSTLNLNTWTNLVFTWTNTDTMKLFVNGQLIQNNYYSTINFSPNPIIPFRIGAGAGACYNNLDSIGRGFWKGSLDDIRIYNRALTQEEISYLAGH